MIGSFKDDETRDVFLTGRSRRFPSIANCAARRLAEIDFAVNVAELQTSTGNSPERLQGERAGHWSLRINDQLRVCFVWDGKDAQEVEIVDDYCAKGVKA